MFKFFLINLILISSIHANSLSSKIKAPIIVCAEDAGWPPFSIPFEGTDKNFQGLNLDILERIFKKHSINFKIVVRPWKRCLFDGKNQDVNIVLDAAKNPQREKDYLLTDSVYSLKPIVFYHEKYSSKFSAPVTPKYLKSLDLICGQKGYTFNNFGLKNEDVTGISKGIHEILELVRKERCSAGLTRKEVLLNELNDYEHSQIIKIQNIIGADVEPFYWLINKNFSYSSELRDLINSELSILNSSGVRKGMLKKYFKK
jgi:polar amino acid transport system substrate-binding protein